MWDKNLHFNRIAIIILRQLKQHLFSNMQNQSGRQLQAPSGIAVCAEREGSGRGGRERERQREGGGTEY
jgi:hypothetical protein